MSAAGLHPSWLSRRTLQRIGDFAFQECHCQMLRCEVPADNKRVLRVLHAVGFEFTYLPRMCGRGRDGVICTLTDDAWYGGRFGRFQQPMKEVA
jgi:RimJ/RimL family protein N-acetyltransferase